MTCTGCHRPQSDEDFVAYRREGGFDRYCLTCVKEILSAYDAEEDRAVVCEKCGESPARLLTWQILLTLGNRCADLMRAHILESTAPSEGSAHLELKPSPIAERQIKILCDGKSVDFTVRRRDARKRENSDESEAQMYELLRSGELLHVFVLPLTIDRDRVKGAMVRWLANALNCTSMTAEDGSDAADVLFAG